MLAVLALGTAETLINQWIDLDAATRQQLNGLSGQLLRVVIDAPQLAVDVWFDHDKIRLNPTVLGVPERRTAIFEQRPYDPAYAPEQATTTLHVANLVELGKLLTAKAGETGNIPLQGDMRLLQQLQVILAQAQPDLASRISPWVGAIPASQLGSIIQQGKQTLGRMASNATNHGAEMLSEDSRLFVARWQMDQFKRNVRTLRQDIERVQARLHVLQQQIQPAPNEPETSIGQASNEVLIQHMQQQQ
ncbi:SCP2 domain-containing protein [Alkanindiges sp. WGS2144]|uniref:ubiquinone biosynthesis accessory factor UbiJ n=1 Tax=Alkanindiges sp. WGS2144 TaxID=3366808 RepID=UPI003753A7E8